MDPLLIIPARGGSKGVPQKNIKKLDGKPLIYYTIDAALEIAEKKDICITTDDDTIIQYVKEYGIDVPFKRPLTLATDQAGMHETIIHALEYYEEMGHYYDSIILLQPTSPFRTGTHVKEALHLYSNDVDMIVSVKETSSNPYYVLFEENDEGHLYKSKPGNYQRRQDCPKVWEFNGAIYIINVNSIKKERMPNFKRIKKYVMDEITSIDIDSETDFYFCEMIIKSKRD